MDLANVDTSSAIESDSREMADEDMPSQDTVDPEEIELSDSEEIVVEETLIQVTTNNPDDMFSMNANSNVRVIAVDSNSPVLQIENKIFHFNEWKYTQGTAMFFEQKEEGKTSNPLYDKRCTSDLQYVGSTQKCLEMTRKNSVL